MTTPTPPAVSEAMREAVARDYVLVKRGLYYRPNSMGYTGVLDEAGRYTEAEAKAQTEHCDGITARLASEAPRFSDACWTETRVKTVQGDLARAEAEIARLTGERDAWKEQASEEAWALAAAEAETARLRAACAHYEKAFNELWDGYSATAKDEYDRARAALTSQEKTNG